MQKKKKKKKKKEEKEEKKEEKTALAFHLIQALYGHDQRDREAFHPHSSLIPNVYVQQARQQLQDNVKFLSIKHLERK